MDPIAHLLSSINQTKPFTDANLSPGQAMMIRTPGGYRAASEDLLSNTQIEAFLSLPGIAGPDWRHRMQRQGGSFGLACTTHNSRLRISVYETGGESHTLRVAIRRLPLKPPSLSDVGLPDILSRLITHGKGLFLITGPTGAGKSTTMAALLDTINKTRAMHIQTIEEPIEYVYQPALSVISQVEVPINIESFQRGVHSALRHRPDVIAIGEMRDKKTVSAALQAASSGHFVMGTLHTSSADESIDAILQFFDGQEADQKRHLLANNLTGVISQALLPDREGKRLVLAYELMLANNAVKKLIRQHKIQQLPGLIEDGRNEGMRTLNDSLNELIYQGRITKNTAYQAAYTTEGLAV